MLRLLHYLRARPLLAAMAALWLAVTVVLGVMSLDDMRAQGGWNPGKPFDLFANDPEE